MFRCYLKILIHWKHLLYVPSFPNLVSGLFTSGFPYRTPVRISLPHPHRPHTHTLSCRRTLSPKWVQIRKLFDMQLFSASSHFFVCEENVGLSHNTQVTNRSSKIMTGVKYLAVTQTNQNCIYGDIKGRLSGWNACYLTIQNCLSSVWHLEIQRLKYTEP